MNLIDPHKGVDADRLNLAKEENFASLKRSYPDLTDAEIQSKVEKNFAPTVIKGMADSKMDAVTKYKKIGPLGLKRRVRINSEIVD